MFRPNAYDLLRRSFILLIIACMMQGTKSFLFLFALFENTVVQCIVQWANLICFRKRMVL